MSLEKLNMHFLIFGILLVFGCKNQDSSTQSSSSSGSGPFGRSSKVATNLEVTAQFNLDSTGWVDSSSAAIKAEVTSSSSSPTFSCRYAHTSVIASKSYSSCNLVGGFVSLTQPGTGVKNGTYKLQVKASSSGGSDTVKTITFYVHDSLNSASVCTLPKTDSEYLALAAPYLDQSLNFRTTSSLKIPFVRIDFPAIAVGGDFLTYAGISGDIFGISGWGGNFREIKSYNVRSLRKRFIKNPANTLMLIKRFYSDRFQNSSINFSRTNCQFSIVDQLLNLDNTTLDLAAGETPPSFNAGDGYFGNVRRSPCDAVVVNALGRAVCFYGNKIGLIRSMTKNFNSPLTPRPQGSGKYSYKSKMTSSKFSAAEQSEYDQTIAVAIGSSDSAENYIYLNP
jgi:hypothetical protein